MDTIMIYWSVAAPWSTNIGFTGQPKEEQVVIYSGIRRCGRCTQLPTLLETVDHRNRRTLTSPLLLTTKRMILK